MAVELKHKSVTVKEKRSSVTELLFFIALNVLVILFSAYQTFIGYAKDVVDNWVAAAGIAAISAVLFAAMNFGIRDRRINGRPHLWQSVMYIIPLAISFLGNFNAFYSNQMRDDLLEQDVTRRQKNLVETHSRARTALEASTDLKKLELEMSSQLSSIQNQFNGGAGKRGWGVECQRDWQHLRKLLEDANTSGARLTNFSYGLDDEGKMRAARNIAETYFKTIKIAKQNEIRPRLNSIDSRLNEAMAEIERVQNAKSIKQDGNELIALITNNNNAIGADIKGYLGSFTYQELEASFNKEIGTIKHSFTSAFVEREQPATAAVSLFLSLVIDLAALLYIMLFVPYNKNRSGGRLGPSTF